MNEADSIDYINAIEEHKYVPQGNKKPLSTLYMILVVATLCSGGGIIYTFPQPAAAIGPVPGLIVSLVTGIIVAYTLDLLVIHLNVKSFKLNDELICIRFPKWRIVILFFTRMSSFILHGTYCIGNFLYFASGIQTLINIHHNISTGALTGITFACMFVLSMILDRNICAKLSIAIAPVPIFNLAATLYYGIRDSTPESWACFKDSWRHPSQYGLFRTDYGAAITACFQFAAQYFSSYYCHNTVPLQVTRARSPKHRRLVPLCTIIALFILYWVSQVVGQAPYACYNVSSDVLPPSEYMSLFGSTGFGIAADSIFIIGLIGNTPITYSVQRDMAFEIWDWTSRTRLRTVLDVIFNICIIVISALFYYYNVSIQTLLEIGGVSCAIVWVALVPCLWDIYVSHNTVYLKFKAVFTFAVCVFVICIEILQFCKL